MHSCRAAPPFGETSTAIRLCFRRRCVTALSLSLSRSQRWRRRSGTQAQRAAVPTDFLPQPERDADARRPQCRQESAPGVDRCVAGRRRLRARAAARCALAALSSRFVVVWRLAFGVRRLAFVVRLPKKWRKSPTVRRAPLAPRPRRRAVDQLCRHVGADVHAGRRDGQQQRLHNVVGGVDGAALWRHSRLVWRLHVSLLGVAVRACVHACVRACVHACVPRRGACESISRLASAERRARSTTASLAWRLC